MRPALVRVTAGDAICGIEWFEARPFALGWALPGESFPAGDASCVPPPAVLDVDLPSNFRGEVSIWIEAWNGDRGILAAGEGRGVLREGGAFAVDVVIR